MGTVWRPLPILRFSPSANASLLLNTHLNQLMMTSFASQEATPLLDALSLCANRQNAAFYTPGHKRGQGISPAIATLIGDTAFRADLPELPELDNLFNPQGVIQQAQALAAEAFGSEQTWFLANGSTCGIEAAVLAVCNPGDSIILPRNVHQSMISALILSGASPIFVQPDYDLSSGLAHGVSPAAIAHALTHYPSAKAIMIVSPTYHGVCPNVAAIAQLAHQHHIPLLVDEAHGPHFAFHPDLPTPALAANADLVIQSAHKVLAAMTQAAMLHVQGRRINRDRLNQALQLTQSTSPNYLLLASLDSARQQMALAGHDLMTRTLSLADLASHQINALPDLSVLTNEAEGAIPGFHQLDRTRLTVDVSGLGITGFAADEFLHEQFSVTAELPTLRHLTFIISLGNTLEDIQRLIVGFEALVEKQGRQGGQGISLVETQYIASRGDGGDGEDGGGNVGWALPTHHLSAPFGEGRNRKDGEGGGENAIQNPQSKIQNPLIQIPLISPRDAFFAVTETLPIEQAVNHICAELICPYPPGIPMLLPGESITDTAIATLQQVLATGGVITGCSDPALTSLKVVKRVVKGP
ncbi:MAG: aminotransferase class I/II-fold pyridoxal phosphate-dependent enzyme [Leptolyngbyaceae cyanobacterium MO_188.B28]|nr:aminotransferase class I/II-fold pyridoxal phosphate-dependent enzyme [Leptolyngbyaceae cyanobacterium MO_188.B28]